MSKILILGNGFDLNLGLKTSYSDFLAGNEFLELSEDSSNLLVSYLNEQAKSSRKDRLWVDIEHELKRYAMLLSLPRYEISEGSWLGQKIKAFEATPSYSHITPPNNRKDKILVDIRKAVKTHFQQLKTALHAYLKRQLEEFKGKSSLIFNNTPAYFLISDNQLIFNRKNTLKGVSVPFDEIYSFNYTNALDLTQLNQYSDHWKNIQFFYVHGSLSENNIVFGVEDGSVPEDFTFLNKSSHAAFGSSPDISDAIINASEVHFFGCSLGNTDDAHFKHPFKVLSQRRNKARKTQLFFYTFGKSGYQNIMKRILALTENRLSEFKITNDVFFYDLESSQLIDQQWINNL